MIKETKIAAEEGKWFCYYRKITSEMEYVDGVEIDERWTYRFFNI